MKNKQTSVDGFVPRRQGSQIGDLHNSKKRSSELTVRRQSLNTSEDLLRPTVGKERRNLSFGRSDIDDSLHDIDEESPKRKLSRHDRRKLEKRSKKTKSKARRLIKWIILLIILAALAYGGYVFVRANLASSKVFKGGIIGVLTQKSVPLQQDSSGRTNILILGTSEDDPGHQAGNLTDSMMILSIDQTNKNAYMISIPRDLYVQYGKACDSGYAGKINVYYSCVGGDPGGTDVDGDRAALTKTGNYVGDIFGLKIQYGVNVNYTVFRDIVNAIGGSINVTIASRDPQGILDSNFDWKCGATYAKRIKNCPPDGHYIQYPNGPVTLDAEHALYLAQARGDVAPTYGFEQSNFDREKNQQMILKAVRDKANQRNFFSNITSVTQLIDSLGNNLRTTFASDEIKTLANLAKEIPDSSIQSVSLIDANPSVVTTGDVDGASVVEPSAGLYDYSDIQALVAKSLSSNPVVREGANVAVLNGSGTSGVAQTEADKLTAKGYIVSDITDADTTDYTGYTVYQIGTGMSATKAALAKLYNVTVKTTTPPVDVPSETNFVVIVGSPASSKTSSN